MPQQLYLPYHVVQLRLGDQDWFTAPLSDLEALHLQHSPASVTQRYSTQLQKKVLNKGDYSLFANELHGEANFLQGALDVAFKPQKKSGLPNFTLTFDYFYQIKETGVWAFVPALPVEAFLISENIEGTISEEVKEALEKKLRESILIDFARKKRLTKIHEVIKTIWYEEIKIEPTILSATIYTPAELENLENEVNEKLLTEAAEELIIKHRVCYGRAAELTRLTRAMRNPYNRNVLLVGPVGVGKTALIQEVAHQKSALLIEEKIWETTASTLIKALMRDTGWQDNLPKLCAELKETGDFLYLRNLSELFQVGQYEGNDVSMGQYILPYIARGEVRVLGECTEEELATINLKSSHFLSYFEVIRLVEPKGEALTQIVQRKIKDLSEQYNVPIDPEAIGETIRLHRRYSPYSGMPGKPLHFLENCLANASNSSQQPARVTCENIYRAYSEETGLPAFMIDDAIPMLPDVTQATFEKAIFGQSLATSTLTDTLAAIKTSLMQVGKPIASYLFVGPTGVGKTELAKQLALFMFGNKERMIRFDMSEYSDPYSVMRLIGQSYFQDGTLTSAIKREPFCVLLFDEIEKADSTFLDLLLQLLSEGRLSDSRGRAVDFCSTIIIMTSNIGAGNLKPNIGFGNTLGENAVLEHFIRAAQHYFRPELYNRIDRVVPFLSLSKEVMRPIVEREINEFRQREGIRYRKMELHLDDAVYDYLATVGFDEKYGARYLRRTINDHFILPVAYELNKFDDFDTVVLKVKIKNKTLLIESTVEETEMSVLFEMNYKMLHADDLADLRRAVETAKDGFLYTELLNDIFGMDNFLKRYPDKFFADAIQSQRYHAYYEIKTNFETLQHAVEHTEQEFALAHLGFQAYPSDYKETAEGLKQAFQSFKKTTYSKIQSEKNQLYLSIYGMEAVTLLPFYLRILKENTFDYTIKSIFYNENLKTKNPTEDSTLTEYVFRDFNEHDWSIKSSDKNELFCGLCFVIHAPAAFLWLEQENFVVKITKEDNKEHFCKVETTPITQDKKGKDTFRIQEAIHRLDTYKKMRPALILDKANLWKLNQSKDVALPFEAFFDTYYEARKLIFEQKLDGAFV
ncbi:MAG: hypothetical protein RLZZ292_223 [Bacteroidota bacterium]|jgi:ATP-dependent Clp protease ATP-binding subunit ClpA